MTTNLEAPVSMKASILDAQLLSARRHQITGALVGLAQLDGLEEAVGQRTVGVGQQHPVVLWVDGPPGFVSVLLDGGDPGAHVFGGDERGQPAVAQPADPAQL